MLYRLLADEPKEDVKATVEALKADYDSRPGLQFVEVAGGYQILTRPELHEWVRRLFHERSAQKLTVQGLETLAVIAYKQPITALEVGEIRGVNTSGVLSTLLERHLIKIVGRKNVVGRPFLYATTKEFLIRFGLKDLGDLPKIEDMAEALGFDPPARLIEQVEGRRGGKWKSLTTHFSTFPLFQLFHFRTGQFPPVAGLQSPVRDRSEPDPPERLNRVADGLEHAPHLAVASLADGDRER
jgi:segregation and condensation protein B